MAVAWRASGSLAVNVTTTTLSVTAPSCQSGDILIAAIINKSVASNAISPPDGTWNEIVQDINDCTTAADDHRFAVYWKRATASGGSFNFTKVTDDNLLFAGVIVAYSGAQKVGSPLDATTRGVTKTAGASDNVSFPAYDPASTDNRTIFVAFYGNDLTTFAAAMSNDTNPDCTKDVDVETSSGTDCTIAFTSGTNDGSNIAARTWASASTTDAGSTGVVFALVAEQSPAIAPNTADATSTSDTTPVIEFTGSDANSDTLEYQFQLDTVNTFDSQSTSLTFSAETFESGSAPWSFDSVGNLYGTASAALDTTGKITGTNSLKLNAESSASVAAIKAHGSDVTEMYVRMKFFLPTATSFSASSFFALLKLRDNANAERLFFTLEKSGSDIILTYNGDKSWTSTSLVITPGQVNTLEVYVKKSATVGRVKVWVNNNTEGSPNYDSGDTNTAAAAFRKVLYGMMDTGDLSGDFYIDDCCYDTAFIGTRGDVLPLLNKLSVTPDATFANTVDGGDTHPFTQAQKVSYEVQAGDALSAGTYYWRARCIDPLGSNVWSAWTTTRSITITSGGSAIQSVGGLAKASVASVGGLAIASVASIGGLA